jgi:hypothetical protein
MPYLSERNEAVESIIQATAKRHAVVDGLVDVVAGVSPVPGSQAVALVGQLLAQTRLIYPP